MINVDLDKIVTAKGLQEHLGAILFEVEEKEEMYIITKQGRPKAALINVDYLQELTGKKVEDATEYDRYPESASESIVTAGAPQTAAPVADTSAPLPVQPVTPAPEPAGSADATPTPMEVDIDSLDIPVEEPVAPTLPETTPTTATAPLAMPESAAPIEMPVKPATPEEVAAATGAATIPLAPNSAPSLGQAQPPAGPTLSQ